VPDDGWEPRWDSTSQNWYFFNRITKVSQWENPRVPDASNIPNTSAGSPQDAPGVSKRAQSPARRIAGGYNPAIHGDYDPNADYAKEAAAEEDEAVERQQQAAAQQAIEAAQYVSTAAFNRFTGKFQRDDLNPERFNDENKSRRQLNAFFDVDAAANAHDGRSLRAERANQKISKKELQQFKQKRREKKEEKRRAWLKD
jgi:hypothetical protein